MITVKKPPQPVHPWDIILEVTDSLKVDPKQGPDEEPSSTSCRPRNFLINQKANGEVTNFFYPRPSVSIPYLESDNEGTLKALVVEGCLRISGPLFAAGILSLYIDPFPQRLTIIAYSKSQPFPNGRPPVILRLRLS